MFWMGLLFLACPECGEFITLGKEEIKAILDYGCPKFLCSCQCYELYDAREPATMN